MKTGLYVADVVTVNSQKVEVRFYPSIQVGSKGGDGYYAVSGSPSTTVALETLNSEGTEFKITKTHGSSVKIWKYEWVSADNAWKLLEGVDPQTGVAERKVLETEETLGNGDLVKTEVIFNGDDSEASRVVRTYRNFIKDGLNHWLMIEEVSDPNGAALTSTWSYYGSSAGTNVYTKLQQSVDRYGAWSTFEYDSNGRLTKQVDGFENSAVASADSLNRVTTFSYTPVSSEDDGSVMTAVARTEVVTLLGQEVSRKYRVLSPFVRKEIVATAAGAAWNATGNLVTVTTLYSAANIDQYAIQKILHPDGSLETYAYARSGNSLTTTHDKGQPNGAGTAVVNGQRTVTVENPSKGVTISTSVYDIASGLLMRSETFSNFDQQNRPTMITYHDGTTIEREYSCCGLASETDREGVETTFTYDALSRQISETRGGVTTRQELDALGRVTSEEREGSDSTTIVLRSDEYDLAGRLISSETPLGTTIYEETITSNGRTQTTTYGDGGTEIRKFAKDGQLLEVSGTAVRPLKYEYGIGSDGSYVKEIRVGAGGMESEWVQRWTDVAGRQSKTSFPGSASVQIFFNAQGQLVKTTDPDGVITLFEYNGQGEQEVVVIDMNRNETIDYSGTDRIAKNEKTVATAHSTTVERTTTSVWDSSSPTVISTVERSIDGLKSWQTNAAGLTTSSVRVRSGGGASTETVTNPDGTYVVTAMQDSRPITVTRYDKEDAELSEVTMSYDGHNRLQESVEVNVGTTTHTYTDSDQPHTVTLPAATTGGTRPVTTYQYDERGRQTHATRNEGETITEYYPTGDVKKVSGLNTYTAEYTYTPQGRLKTLTAGSGITNWYYDTQRGWLNTKMYNDGRSTSYTYLASGRLNTRTWARGVTTTYGYDNGGSLASINYSDATPDVSFGYDRRGRRNAVSDAAGTRAITYGTDDQRASETYSGTGILSGIAITRGYDAKRRLSSVTAANGGTTLSTDAYTYDDASRLATVSNADNSVTYGYDATLGVANSIEYSQIETTMSYDKRRRLTGVTTSKTSNVLAKSLYDYDTLDRRTRQERADGSFWNYLYDTNSQLTSAKRKWQDGSLVAGQQYEFEWDSIGNRTRTAQGGDPSGGGLRDAIYVSNALNQYRQRGVPGKVDLIGTAETGTTVTVDSEAVVRQGKYFWKEVNLNNATSPVWATAQVRAVLKGAGSGGSDIISTESRELSVSKTPEIFTHDLDGNLTQDGKWNYSWDAENRLIAIESISSVVAANKKKFEFAYDGDSRRVRSKAYTWNSGTSQYQLSSETKFVYDGWLCLAETNGSLGLVRSYCWGADLSGTFEGAGGVGGLLWMKDAATGVVYNASYDGNGNVVKLTKASDGSIAASYEYSPFGEVIESSGSYAASNPFRSSTKYQDGSRLLYYGYRYMNPDTGRWLSRDPIGEVGGTNLYGYVANSPVNRFDPYGLLDSVQAYQHYIGGTETPLGMSFSEIDTSGVKPSQFPRVQDAIREFKTKPSPERTVKIIWRNRDDNLPFATSGDQAAFLGDISLKLEGDFKIQNGCKWEFSGTLKSFDDYYDFNKSTHRRVIGELLTTLGRSTPGKNFWIEIRGAKQISEKGDIKTHQNLGGGGGGGWY